MTATNGHPAPEEPLNRANEVHELLTATTALIVPFVAAADAAATSKASGRGTAAHSSQETNGTNSTNSANGTNGVHSPRTALVEQHSPKKLEALLAQELEIREESAGKEGLLRVVAQVLRYSVNTWDQGFLDKLYASTNAVGLVSELLLAALNTNAHVYQVSPVLTLIEKRTTKFLAQLFNLPATTSGGISQPGGSASNSTAIVVARNTLYPDTKTDGNGSHKFTIFTSAHGHYSVEKAANLFGLGSKNVISIPVDDNGAIIPTEFERLVIESKDRGETPLFLNATAGTTVLGSFDPYTALNAICRKHNLWFHVDGSWGGSVVFSPQYRDTRLSGAHLADSITINPHKMLGTPVTCSFLLGRDMNTFYKALTLPAGYLFHNSPGANVDDIYDLADLTPQCGRRADSFKLYLALQYYGTEYFAQLVDRAYENAEYLLAVLKRNGNFVTISPEPLPCLQVCFYYAKEGVLGSDAEENGKQTAEIASSLIGKGFMIDFAPGERGKFFRVVVNGGTKKGTLDGLAKAIELSAAELNY